MAELQGDNQPRIDEMLLSRNAATKDQIEVALRYQKAIGGRLVNILVKLGYIDDNRLAAIMAERFGLAVETPDFSLIPDEIRSLFGLDVITRLQAVPLRREGTTLVVGIADPYDFPGVRELEKLGGNDVRFVILPQAVLRNFLDSLVASRKIDTGGRRRASGRFKAADIIGRLKKDCLREAEDAALAGSEVEARFGVYGSRDLVMGMLELLFERRIISPGDLLEKLESRRQEK